MQDLRNVNVNRVTTQNFNIQDGPLNEPVSARTATIQNNSQNFNINEDQVMNYNNLTRGSDVVV